MGMNFNFLGLGVSFGGRDQGLEREQGLVHRGFLAIKDSIGALADASPFERMGEGVQRMADHVTDVVNQVRGLSEGVNLTTGYEAHMQALSVESRRLGANMGYAGSQLNRFSSRAAGLADGLNISAQDAAQAIDAVARGGEGLRLVGIRTAADAARFQASGLGDISAISSQIHQMRSEYELTDAQIQQVIGSTAAMGRATGNVNAAFQSMGGVIDALRQRAALQGSTLDPAELARSAAEVQGLAAGFYQMTHNAEEARRMALDVFQSQLGAQQNWSNMFAGTESDVSDFVTNMSVAQGDVNQAFTQMRQGPAEFVRGLVQMYRTAKRNGPVTAEQFNFLRAQMERALGPQSAQMMVNFMRSADDAALDTMTSVQGATADLGRMGREAHRTGRTLQEEFQRVKDIGTASFRSIGRHEAVAMVRDTAREFRVFNGVMRDAAASGGPMAAVVERLSAIHQIGALALLPGTLRPMAVLFGHLTDQLVPLITALGAMGFRVGALLNPYTLVIAAVGFLVLNFFDLYVRTRSVSAAFDGLIERVTNFGRVAGDYASRAASALLNLLDGWSEEARAWAETFDWGGFFARWINRALHAILAVGGWFQSLGDKVFEELGRIFTGQNAQTRVGGIVQNLGVVLQRALSGLGDALSRIDWRAAGRIALMGLLGAMLGPVLGTTVAVMPWGRLGKAISDGLNRAMSFVRGGGLGTWLTTQFRSMTATIAREWPPIEAEIIRWARTIPPKISAAIAGGGDFLTRLFTFLTQAVTAVRRWVEDHQDEIVSAVSAIGSRVFAALGWLGSQAVSALWQWIRQLPALLPRIGEFMQASLLAAARGLQTLAMGLVASITTALSRAFPQYASTFASVRQIADRLLRFMYDTFSGGLSTVFNMVGTTIRGMASAFTTLAGVASSVVDTIQHPWEAFKAWFLGMYAELRTGGIHALVAITAKWDEAKASILAAWEEVKGYFALGSGEIRGSFGGAIEWIEGKWESFKAKVRSGIDEVSGLLRSIFGGGGEADQGAQRAGGMAEGVASTARSVVTDTTRAVSGGIVSGLVGAFRSGFGTVLSALNGFKDRFLDVFARFGRLLRDKVMEALDGARQAINNALAGIEGAIAAITGRLRSAMGLAAQLMTATAVATPAQGTPGAPAPAATSPVRRLDHPTGPEDLRQAIHDPLWARTYMAVFDLRMGQLVAAVERGGRNGQASGGRRQDPDRGGGDRQRTEEGIQAGR